MLTNNAFNKKIFTAGIMLKDLGFLLVNSLKIIKALGERKISRAFIEKIMTVTTAVNGCVYCKWFHARQAVECGISDEAVRNLLNLQFQSDATEFEIMALLYAQHFAETDRIPDPVMTQKLFDYYGEKTARQIILFIRMIFFGNLYGNTWDAVWSRFKGAPAPNSNVFFELVYFLLNFPIMLPAMILMKLDQKKSNRSQVR